MRLLQHIALWVLLLAGASWAQAQTTQELERQIEQRLQAQKQQEKKERKAPKPQYGSLSNSTRAAIYSAVLPGLGQIYNKKYWKLPIIYGGFAVFSYIVRDAHYQFIEARNYLAYVKDADPSNDALIPDQFKGLSADSFQRRVTVFRRDRDFYTIMTVLWYGLACADAAVDAHMKGFDVSEDLSGVIRPKLGTTDAPFGQQPVLGLALGLRFKR